MDELMCCEIDDDHDDDDLVMMMMMLLVQQEKMKMESCHNIGASTAEKKMKNNVSKRHNNRLVVALEGDVSVEDIY